MSLGKAPELIALESLALEPFNFSDQSTVLSELSRLVEANHIRLVMTQASYQEMVNCLHSQPEHPVTDSSSQQARVDQFQDFLSQLAVLVLPIEVVSEEQAEVYLPSKLTPTLVNEAHKTRQRMFVVSPKKSWQDACEEHQSLQYSSGLEVLLERLIGESRRDQRGDNFVDYEDTLFQNYFKDEFSYAFGGLEAWGQALDRLLDCQISILGNEPETPHFNKLRIATIDVDSTTIIKVTPRSNNQLLTIYSAPILVFLVLTPGEGERVWDLDDLEDGLHMEPDEWQASCIIPCEVEAILTENTDGDDSPVRYTVSEITVDPCNACNSISLVPIKSSLGNYLDMVTEEAATPR